MEKSLILRRENYKTSIIIIPKASTSMKRLLTILAALLLLCQSVRARQMETFTRLNNEGYNFWLYSPDSTGTEKKPLIVYLHGQSICGKNIDRVLRYGTLDALRRGRQLDAYVVAPHNPGGRWSPAKVVELVDWVQQHYAADSCRTYVLGMSLGGFGTIDVASAYPNRFAAAMALCGGGNNPDCRALCSMPLWILHGTRDRDVNIRESDMVVRAMRDVEKPTRLLYDRLKGLDHSKLARCFYMPQTYDWLFAHSLEDSARVLCTDYSITVNDFSHAYDGLSSPTWDGIQQIRHHVPTREEAAEPATGGNRYYVIKKGDSLSTIARKHRTTVRKLCKLNGIKETTKLQIGKRLKVK